MTTGWNPEWNVTDPSRSEGPMNLIVKVQRALYPVDASMLLYDETRDFEIQLPYEGPFKAAMGDQVKSFFEVTIDGGEINILRELPDQGW